MTNKYGKSYKSGNSERIDAGAEIVANLIVVPLLLVLLWNYGMTELLQQVGVPDANVNVFVGLLAVLFLRGIVSYLFHR